VKDGRLYVKPHIPMLAEHNVRKGFLEPAQFADVKAKLSPALGAGVRLSHGLAIGVEVLPLEWRTESPRGAVVAEKRGLLKTVPKRRPSGKRSS
jgi:hypothetical protein